MSRERNPRSPILAILLAATLTELAWLALPGNAAAGYETINLRIPSLPKFSYDDKVGKMHRTLMVLEGTSEKDWTEGIEVLYADRKGAYKDPRAISTAMRASRRETCEVVRDSTLADDESSIFWSTYSDSCLLFAPQFSMTRVLCGKKTTFILIYTSHVPELSSDRRNEIASALLGTKVVND